MIRGLEAVTLLVTRENFDKVLAFYRDTLGLKVEDEAEMGDEDKYAGLKIGDANLYLMSNPDIHDEAHEPERTVLNLEVDDIEKEEKRLKDAKAKQIEPIYHIEGYGYSSTFADPEGNHFNIVQIRANE